MKPEIVYEAKITHLIQTQTSSREIYSEALDLGSTLSEGIEQDILLQSNTKHQLNYPKD